MTQLINNNHHPHQCEEPYPDPLAMMRVADYDLDGSLKDTWL